MAILSWESLGSGDVVDVQVEEQLVGSPLGCDDGGLWPIPLLFVGKVFLDMRFQLQEVRPDSDPAALVFGQRHSFHPSWFKRMPPPVNGVGSATASVTEGVGMASVPGRSEPCRSARERKGPPASKVGSRCGSASTSVAGGVASKRHATERPRKGLQV